MSFCVTADFCNIRDSKLFIAHRYPPGSHAPNKGTVREIIRRPTKRLRLDYIYIHLAAPRPFLRIRGESLYGHAHCSDNAGTQKNSSAVHASRWLDVRSQFDQAVCC